MNTLRWQNISRFRSLCSARRWRCRRNTGRRVFAPIGNPPDPATLIVGYVERAIGPDRQSGRAMRRSTRLLIRPGEAVGEDDKGPGSFAVGERLEGDVVAPLRFRGAVPGPVEC